MRVTATDGALSVKAVSGTHVVLLGINLPKSECPGLLGFAIHRTDHTEEESYWLYGQKRFEWADDRYLEGREVSTRFHPIQSFLWQDFTAKPAHSYTYRISELRGDPENGVIGRTVSVTINTERQDDGVHRIFFNRGAVSSQKYAEEFNNQDPRVVGNPAWQWLSRGLFEALKAFIDRAGPGHFLRAALYETREPKIFQALKEAAQRGADVQIVYDGRENAKIKTRIGEWTGKWSPKDPNETILDQVGILTTLCKPRTKNKSSIAHNKFIVFGTTAGNGELSPEEVWTGSTNITESGIFGHLNVGHSVNDGNVAKAHLSYWTELEKDPASEDLRDWTVENSPIKQDLPSGGMNFIFSPRDRAAPSSLAWYVDMMKAAQKASFLTGAFGLPAAFVPVLETDSAAVRYVLLDSYGSGDAETIARRKQLVRQLRQSSANKIVVANLLRMNAFDHWLQEKLNPISTNVRYLHTKFLLVDPLSDDPWVVTGSANFSDDSTFDNDENMLAIRGDTRVADIYLTEFMRMYRHYVFREWAATNSADVADVPYLDTTDTWWASYFQSGNLKSHQREYFAA
ncbi:phospholipase D-like domain-containing protein [Rhizobium mongolense]|uniref:phospholipase D-like domain-containing protein n=1 Tax=Rhizobium mongolense TaxID=57676 RepID=UPI0034A2BBF9